MLPSGQSSGDFSDVGKSQYRWSAERNATGTGNLDVIKVQVATKDDVNPVVTEVQALLCRPNPPKSGGSQ
jgi:hypothetical protein